MYLLQKKKKKKKKNLKQQSQQQAASIFQLPSLFYHFVVLTFFSCPQIESCRPEQWTPSVTVNVPWQLLSPPPPQSVNIPVSISGPISPSQRGVCHLLITQAWNDLRHQEPVQHQYGLPLSQTPLMQNDQNWHPIYWWLKVPRSEVLWGCLGTVSLGSPKSIF